MTDHTSDGKFAVGNEAWLKRVEVTKIRKVKELRELARNMTPKAMVRIFQRLDDPDPRVQIQAATIILDRGWGKAASIDPEKQEDIAIAHLEALRAIGAGASADVVAPDELDRLKKNLDQLPKLSGIRVQDVPSDVEDINDINDLGDDQVNDDLNNGDQEGEEEEKSNVAESPPGGGR